MAERCMTSQPICGVATRTVCRPQSDSVPTVNGGISVNCESKNRTICSYFKSIVFNHDIVRQGANMSKPNWKCDSEISYFNVLFSGPLSQIGSSQL